MTLVNEEKEYESIEIGSIDDIYKYAEQLKATAQRYDDPTPSESSESAEIRTILVQRSTVLFTLKSGLFYK